MIWIVAAHNSFHTFIEMMEVSETLDSAMFDGRKKEEKKKDWNRSGMFKTNGSAWLE